MEANLEIKEYLESKGISQAFLGRKTGISFSKLLRSAWGRHQFLP